MIMLQQNRMLYSSDLHLMSHKCAKFNAVTLDSNFILTLL